MMTMEGFRKYIAHLQEKGMPFAAYWHAHGFGVLLLGPVSLTRQVWKVTNPRTGYCQIYRTEQAAARAKKEKELGPNARMETLVVKDKPKPVSDAVVKRWLRRRSACPRPCLFVDCDGKEIKTEGGLEYLWQN